jgi:hypothetical protein
MTYSRTQIYNLALNALGITAPIAHGNQNDPRAIVLSNSYEVARDTVLEDFDWGFAENYQDLPFTTSKSMNPRFKYQFDYPNDCIEARAIIDVDKGKEKVFKRSSGKDGQKVILTNTNPCRLRYTRRVEKEVYFSAGFVSALAQYLGGLCGEALTGQKQKAGDCLNRYSYMIAKAQVNSATEAATEDEEDNTYIDSRY